MKTVLTTTALTAFLATGAAFAEPQDYTIDPDHSEILVSWNHGEFSTTRGLVFDISGEMTFDEEDPTNSTVSIEIPVEALVVTPALKDHLMSDDFFGDNTTISFESTSITVDGDDEGEITGDLTINGVTQEVTLDAELTNQGEGPMGNPVVGFEGETTIIRSDYGLGAFAPFVSDEVQVEIALEASPAE